MEDIFVDILQLNTTKLRKMRWLMNDLNGNLHEGLCRTGVSDIRNRYTKGSVRPVRVRVRVRSNRKGGSVKPGSHSVQRFTRLL